MTCTRPREAIACEDSPMFYDVNMEFGKVSNESKEQAAPESKPESGSAPASSAAANTDTVASTPQRWNQGNRKKQNIVAQTLFKDVALHPMARKQDIKDYGNKIMEAIKENIKDYNHNVVQTMNQDFGELNHGIQDLKEEIKEVEKEIVIETGDIKENDKEKSQIIKDNVKEIVHDKEEEAVENIKRIITNEMEHSTMVTDGEVKANENGQTVELPHSVLRKIEAMNAEPIAPVVIEETVPDVQDVEGEDSAVEEFDNSRIASERSLKRTGKVYRGSFRYRSDAF